MMTGQSEGFLFLMVSTMVMSFGFHFFYPTSNAVVLMAVDKRDAPRTLGQLGSLNAIAMIVATGAVFLLADPLGYRTLYMIVGVLILAGGLALLPFKGAKEGLPPRRQVVLRRRYWWSRTVPVACPEDVGRHEPPSPHWKIHSITR